VTDTQLVAGAINNVAVAIEKLAAAILDVGKADGEPTPYPSLATVVRDMGARIGDGLDGIAISLEASSDRDTALIGGNR
jgi:hypothetical protein